MSTSPTSSRDRMRAHRARQSKAHRNNMQRMYRLVRRQDETPHGRTERQRKERERKRKQRSSIRSEQRKRQHQTKSKIQPDDSGSRHQSNDRYEQDDLLQDESIAKAKKEALEYLHRTQVGSTDKHIAHVCVICD